ncbi:hypothetical protein M0802_015368 [Mischocyttarus mexicanus]|nr:hypothetical protein M0802_015371 [Mischocyttarus mexicanus]KAI4474961.1 hypothetical protein M0802_015368 [Mischocyttarus mexicanus]
MEGKQNESESSLYCKADGLDRDDGIGSGSGSGDADGDGDMVVVMIVVVREDCKKGSMGGKEEKSGARETRLRTRKL